MSINKIHGKQDADAGMPPEGGEPVKKEESSEKIGGRSVRRNPRDITNTPRPHTPKYEPGSSSKTLDDVTATKGGDTPRYGFGSSQEQPKEFGNDFYEEYAPKQTEKSPKEIETSRVDTPRHGFESAEKQPVDSTRKFYQDYEKKHPIEPQKEFYDQDYGAEKKEPRIKGRAKKSQKIMDNIQKRDYKKG